MADTAASVDTAGLEAWGSVSMEWAMAALASCPLAALVMDSDTVASDMGSAWVDSATAWVAWVASAALADTVTAATAVAMVVAATAGEVMAAAAMVTHRAMPRLM